MTVDKTNGFAAPYRSLTLRKEKKAIVQRNGLLSIDGKISETGGNVTVPPMSFLQNGMAVNKPTSTIVPKPPSLVAPYYITVSAQSSINIDDLIFQFVKSPFDLNSEVVILGEYDGTAWRNGKTISTDGLIKEALQEVVDTKKIGPYEGLLTSVSGPNFLTTKGLIYDIVGDRVLFENDTSFPIIATDPDSSFKRVDRVVYRRPLDDENRIGVRSFLTGGTFSSGPQVVNLGNFATSISPNGQSKFVISSDNSVHEIYANGFGGNFSLVYKKLAADRSTITASATIIASLSSDNFDIAISGSNQIYITYVDNGRLFITILDSNGATVASPMAIETLTNPCSNPRVVLDTTNNKFFIAFEYLETSTLKQVYVTTRSLTGALIKSAQRVTSTVVSTIEPDIFVTSDLIIHLAYNQGGVIYFTKLDDNIVSITTPIVISTSVGSQSFGILNNNSLKPHVLVFDNMEVSVSFLIKKNLTDYGFVVWSEESGQAFCLDLQNSSENITNYSIDTDNHFNDLYISYTNGSSEARFTVVKDLMPVLNEQLLASNISSIISKKDKQGSMFHNWTIAAPGTYSNTGSPLTVTGIGTLGVAGSMNSLSLSDTQFYMPFNTSVKKGMEASITGSIEGNDGVYLIESVVSVSVNSVNDFIVITTVTPFPNHEATSVSIQLKSPDGNAVQFCKSIAEKNSLRALSIDTLKSDILLARVVLPGSTILNYIPNTGIAINSDLFGMYGDIDVDWGDTSPGALTMSNGLRVVDLVRNLTYTVNGGSFAIAEGYALYIEMDGITTTITPSISPIENLPWALPIQVLGFVANSEFNPHLFSVAGMGQMVAGESIVLGQDLPKPIRARLGITSELSMTAYDSNSVINPSDPYPIAISKIDAAVGAMMAMRAQEEDFLVGIGGQSIFTKTVIADWNADNSYLDIQVFVNGRKQKQDITGGALQDYKKTSADTIQFNITLPRYAVVTIRNERTGAPPMGGGGVDLINITVNPQPVLNASNSLGTVTKAWQSVFLKDTVSAQVYEIKIVGGVLQAVLVP